MRDLLIQSCNAYYDYLNNNHKGVQDIQIASHYIQDNFITIKLRQKRFSLDYIQIAIDDYSFLLDHDEIINKTYDENNQILTLQCKPSLFTLLSNALESKKLKIYTDLKFLITNLRDFFQKYNISLPTKTPQHTTRLTLHTNESQKQAIYGALNNTLSYIWGPPGTGKTQFVLFEILMHFIETNKKVCVIAPTNNALEQILSTIITQLDNLKFNRDKTIRLGIPTTTFFNKFSDTCEYTPPQQTNLFNYSTYSTPIKKRYENAIIFGMTIDGFIRKYSDLEINFTHFFLDESAFTPLIKALALCVDNTPITLLGDHKQLSPICEMPNQEMINKNKSVKLWSISALYLEDFFEPTFLNNLDNIKPDPSFDKMQLFKLNITYRYGKNLAKILAENIYTTLESTHNHTEIFYANATPSTSHTNELFSSSEAEIARKIYQELKHEDIAILTPFNKQKEYIQKLIHSPNVMTIHSSQGREFDTIILSPVTLHHYCTNSQNKTALYTLNVAITRLKKRLIIVCDYNFWIKQKNQLLCKLLEQAKPYEFKQK
ncbi:AAA domain-containing protein [Helicobacter anatolicus]|uniref:AAA domain-containing protein n=1 Tax=Helicobacter anatolicus TaxID=2905874 RepID=UPI001E4732BC|nr:AAA domain-containing protein [Helicobacter anatolicus]MCE3037882.1 AAA domain-containing protein [Helicobacter anatolicus]